MPLDASAESVAEFLGQPVLTAITDARDSSADDLEMWRRTSPSEIAASSARGLANRIHDRFMHHMLVKLDGAEGVRLDERGSTRQFVVNERVILRCKRHDEQNKIKSYPTRAAIEHWGGTVTLDGMATINLAAGYRWDKELRELGPAVLSFRKSLHARPLWTVDLGRSVSVADPVRIVGPLMPGMPAIDLFGIGAEQQESESR